jgi:malonyl-CoA O-methyltransferase
MKAVREFSRFASSYGHYSVIQRQAAEYLVSWIEGNELGDVVDLGCGDGEILRQLRRRRIGWSSFVGIDLSERMLELHPRETKVRCLRGDFNDSGFLDLLGGMPVDTLLSSSALQWSRDLDRTLEALSGVGCRAYFSIFTSGTFATLHRHAGLSSPIRSFEETEELLLRYYHAARVERVRYRLHFDSIREMFRYIKRSGVSGGEARLGYRQIRSLMEAYPLDYLEFELLFASLVPRRELSSS